MRLLTAAFTALVLGSVLAPAHAQNYPIEQGIDVRISTPEEFVAHVRAETEKWTKVVRAANIPMQ